jgi:CPA2 family monovalent cation:H+ antiporter-2
LLGALAHRLCLSPLIGYLIAGVLIGPATPGFVADQTLASELAEIGVILLALAHWLGWSIGAGLVFGLALSVGSTVVLRRGASRAAPGRDRAGPHRRRQG